MIAYTFVLLLAVYFLTGLVLPIARNIHIAKRTGLQYVTVPYFMYGSSWPSKFVRRPFLKLLDILFHDPNPSPASWQRLISPLWPLKFRHAPFTLLGTDTFLTVAPGGIVLNTADAEVITQILSRPVDFPKPTQLYRGISIYGKNLFSTEGPSWKRQRKLINPAFSEKTNKLVWKETVGQSQAMVASWIGTTGSGERHVARDTMRLSLAIIGEL
jgi:cytochrome P450